MKKETTISETAAKSDSLRATSRGRLAGGIASVLATIAALICPACIPAIAGFLASLGLGFALKQSFIGPLLIALLIVSMASFAWAARLHRHWWILVTGGIGAAIIYISRFVWFRPALMWIGAALLIGTSLINFKLKRACSRCAPTDQNQREETK